MQHDKLPLSKNTTVAERERVKRMNKQSKIILTAAYCKRYARKGTIAEGRLETKKLRGFGKIVGSDSLIRLKTWNLFFKERRR